MAKSKSAVGAQKSQKTASTAIASSSRSVAKKKAAPKKKAPPKVNPKKVDQALFYNADCVKNYVKFSKASTNEVRVFREDREPKHNLEVFLEPFKSSGMDKLLCLDLPTHAEEARQFYANLTPAVAGGYKTMVHKHEFPVNEDTINAAIGCVFTPETLSQVKRVTYKDGQWPETELLEQMRRLFGNPPISRMFRPESYTSNTLGAVDKMCYKLLVNNIISAGHSTENTINGMALFTHLKAGHLLDPGYIILQDMLRLEKQKTGKRIPYGNLITKLITDGAGTLTSTPIGNKYYDSTYFVQRQYRLVNDEWINLRSQGEGGIARSAEEEDGEGQTTEPRLKRSVWRKISDNFLTLFAKIDHLQKCVDRLQAEREVGKKSASDGEDESSSDDEETTLAPNEDGEDGLSSEEETVKSAKANEDDVSSSSSDDESIDLEDV